MSHTEWTLHYIPSQRAAQLLDGALSSLQSQLGLLAFSEEMKVNEKLVPVPPLHSCSPACGMSAVSPLHRAGPLLQEAELPQPGPGPSTALPAAQATSTAQVSRGAHLPQPGPDPGQSYGCDRCAPCPGKAWLRPFPEQGNQTRPKPGTRGSSRGSRRVLAKSSSFPALSGPCSPLHLYPRPAAPAAPRTQPHCPQPNRDLGRDQLRPQSLLSCYRPEVRTGPWLHQLPEQALQPHSPAARLV